MTTRAPIVGIDLGTTFSLVSVLQAGRPVLLPNALGETLTPSAVSLDEDGSILVGAPARARASTHPESTVLAFKRDMGTDRVHRLGAQTFSPVQLSALVLAALKRDAEHALGLPVEEAVVTVPAYFGEAQRQATRDAATLAGLRVDRILNEPTAAALAYGLEARGRELRCVVLDLGGGTFDVTVLEIIEGVIEIQSSAGDARLGGEDFTDALAAHAAAQIRERYGLDVSQSEVAKARVREAAEHAKRRLAVAASASLVVPALEVPGKRVDVELEIARDVEARVYASLLERLRAPVHRALRDAKVDPARIDEVLLVGGATRMPCVAQLAATLFGRLPLRHLPPDEAVAQGAAVQAALVAGDAAVEDVVVTDVAPFTLGIGTAERAGRVTVDGLFSPVLERGTVIPASRVRRFTTIEDDQTELRLEVFQGEHSHTRDNTRIGELLIRGMPRRPRGTLPLDVRFTYDLNGLIEVEVDIEGRKESLVIEQRPGSLTKLELERARDAMRALKIHPRETLPNRTALARADALYVELSGESRDALGRAIAAFRAALETQQPRTMDDHRERLVALTSALARGGRRP